MSETVSLMCRERVIRMFLSLLLCCLFETLFADQLPSSACVKPKPPILDVFFLNLDHSLERRLHMSEQLLYYRLLAVDKIAQARVRAITPKNFVIPKEIGTPFHCARLDERETKVITNEAVEGDDPYILITAHCGRPRNVKREMAVTLSHLMAIKAATDNTQSDAKYALILEDDMEFAYDLDFSKLIDSAPKGWGILQLITSNSYDINQLWQQYKDKGTIWTLRSYQDLWCAGGYIIRKELLRPIVNGIFRTLENGWTGASIIAGYDKPCTPAYCCSRGVLSVESPCVRSPRGYQADHFIFSLADQSTYMLHTPVLSGARTGNRSTLHQDHVSLIHVEAFRRINSNIDELRNGMAKLPPFILDPHCRFIRNTTHSHANVKHSPHHRAHGKHALDAFDKIDIPRDDGLAKLE